MSYDLCFWRQRTEGTLSPRQVYEFLMDEKDVESLEALPVDRIVSRLKQAFPGLKEQGGLTRWEGNDLGMFELYWSPKYVQVCCRQLVTTEINKIIDILDEFGCPLYDPQVDTRFSP